MAMGMYRDDTEALRDRLNESEHARDLLKRQLDLTVADSTKLAVMLRDAEADARRASSEMTARCGKCGRWTGARLRVRMLEVVMTGIVAGIVVVFCFALGSMDSPARHTEPGDVPTMRGHRD